MPHGDDLHMLELMDKACTVADLGEWGDRGFTEPLQLLLDSCASTGALNPTGRRVLAKVVVRHLVNRLQLHEHVRAHPDAAAPRVGPAIVVTGLPRTGTTLLHNLLAQDPEGRVLRFWEALHPVPSQPGQGPSRADLVRQATSWLESLYELIPSFRVVHAATAEGPEECDALLQNEFASQHFDDMFNAEAYSEWLASAGLAEAYESYALQLRVIAGSASSDRHWVLKSPSHLGHLDALLAACPDATIVHCHRHPVEAVPSYASLMLTLRSVYSDSASPALIGRQALHRCRVAMERAMAVRATVADKVVDVSYRRLVEDPVATVHSLYDRLGRRIPDGFDVGMRRWLADNPKHRHGVHRYDLGTFGLTTDEISSALAPYLSAALRNY